MLTDYWQNFSLLMSVARIVSLVILGHLLFSLKVLNMCGQWERLFSLTQQQYEGWKGCKCHWRQVMIGAYCIHHLNISDLWALLYVVTVVVQILFTITRYTDRKVGKQYLYINILRLNQKRLKWLRYYTPKPKKSSTANLRLSYWTPIEVNE